MQDDKLPVGSTGDDARLPARRETLPSQHRPGVLSVEMLAEERREDRDEIALLAYPDGHADLPCHRGDADRQ